MKHNLPIHRNTKSMGSSVFYNYISSFPYVMNTPISHLKTLRSLRVFKGLVNPRGSL